MSTDANLRPSGPIVPAYTEATLNLLPAQPTAKQHPEHVEPRTWSFVASPSGELITVTCMDGCNLSHDSDIETPSYPEDIWCQNVGDQVTLPVNDSGQPEEVAILRWTIGVRPWDGRLSNRVPTACVEVMEDAWIEDLDPDAFAQVIATLEERVRGMRAAHAELLRVRAEYIARCQA
ncbi:hypothetical protein HRW23_22070 [Streptomyces lunaelactis]|uniref:DUF6907 domain-containing protein n=1 Tax=Streptomyces lunaelactis TaxID=1535768 RepID=UPI001584C85F|nr:hypothetical protein [Streptomyces lunaelactis]NUK72127.1 hypothetical protein [Streptomyces lunaelactis]NUK80035.1 hypothetical protein [Streptomyces lunaelactis]